MNEISFPSSLEEKQKNDADIGSASQEEEEEEEEGEDRKRASEVREHLIFFFFLRKAFFYTKKKSTSLANLVHMVLLSSVRTPENLIPRKTGIAVANLSKAGNIVKGRHLP